MRLQPCTEEIHPADEMYRYSKRLVHGDDRAARHLYLEKGRQIAEAIEQVAAVGFGSLSRVPSLLDFASGFGRGTRFVVSALDPGRITACEIQPGAPAFLRSSLGVGSIEAATRPEDLAPDRRFSMIIASSFFSHCPPDRIAGWLDRLLGLLAADGVLAFSVNDLGEAPPEARRDGPDVAFSRSSESDALTADDYGTTWIGSARLRDLLADARRAGATIERVPKGLCAHQDLWIVRQGAAASRELAYQRHPAGHVEEVTKRGDRVQVVGWAEDLDRPGCVQGVTLRVEGRPVRSIAPARPDSAARQTWSCDLPSGWLGIDDLAIVDAVAASGRTSLLGVGSLRPFL